MPTRDEERAVPRGERLAVHKGLEIQLATIHGTEEVDASLGGHGYMVDAPIENPGFIVFHNRDYVGHYTLPEDLAKQSLPELVKADYLQEILKKCKK